MIFKPAARYPADPRAVFVLAASVFFGFAALALSVTPKNLDVLVPGWGIWLWAGTLTLGSVVALVGMLIQTVNGIVVEQVGSVMVGAAAIFYSAITLRYVGDSALQSAGLIMAWGFACLLRWAQLQMLINDAHKVVSAISSKDAEGSE